MRDWARRVRSSDPITSAKAAASVDLRRSQRVALDLLEEIGPCTAEALEFQALVERLPVSPSRLRTALVELQALGLVAPTGQVELTKFGREARVWSLVDRRAA